MRRATIIVENQDFLVLANGIVSTGWQRLRIGKVKKLPDGWYGTLDGEDVPIASSHKTRKAAVEVMATGHLRRMPEVPCSFRERHHKLGISIYEPAIVKAEYYERWSWSKASVCADCMGSRILKVVEYLPPLSSEGNNMGDGIDLRCVQGWIEQNLQPYTDDKPDGLHAWARIETHHQKDFEEFGKKFFEAVEEKLMERPDVGPWINAAEKAEVSEHGYGGRGLGTSSNHLIKFPMGYALTDTGSRYRGTSRKAVKVWCGGLQSEGEDIQIATARFLRDNGGILVTSPTPAKVEWLPTDDGVKLTGPAGMVIDHETDVPALLVRVAAWYVKNGSPAIDGYRDLLMVMGMI
jgi:hypothetical protein